VAVAAVVVAIGVGVLAAPLPGRGQDVPPPPPPGYATDPAEQVPPPPEQVPPPPEPVRPPPTSGPAPAPGPAPDYTATSIPDSPTPTQVRPRSFSAIGLGGGLWMLTHGGTGGGALLHPSVVLEIRRGWNVADQLGLELVTNIAFHDFEAIGDAYAWYGIKDEWQFWKFAVLWPGLVLAPLVGSHLSNGAGIVIYSGALPPTVIFDAGVTVSMFLRPSDSEFLFGFGAFAGLGLEISGHATALLRFVWGPPTLNSVFTDIDDHVLSWMLMIQWVR